MHVVSVPLSGSIGADPRAVNGPAQMFFNLFVQTDETSNLDWGVIANAGVLRGRAEFEAEIASGSVPAANRTQRCYTEPSTDTQARVSARALASFSVPCSHAARPPLLPRRDGGLQRARCAGARLLRARRLALLRAVPHNAEREQHDTRWPVQRAPAELHPPICVRAARRRGALERSQRNPAGIRIQLQLPVRSGHAHGARIHRRAAPGGGRGAQL